MKRLFAAMAIAATLTSMPLFANAEEASSAATLNQQTAAALNIAEQGFVAVQDVRMSRLAIFQGVPEHAVKLTDAAAKLLADDSTDWKKFASTGKKAAGNDQYIVIDGEMGISENFVATPAKQEAIKKANEQISKGDKKGAIETLRLADIAVTQNLYLLPLKHAQKTVAEAQKLLAEKKYYEANLALKAVEDSVIIDGSAVIAD